MQYRNLNAVEITKLESQGCISDDWQDIFVHPKFSSDRVRNCEFSGKNHIGELNIEVTLQHGLKTKAGLYNSCFYNCSIGNGVFIKNIGNLISNYLIEDNVQIVNTNEIICSGESYFGNGTQVLAVNEAGGREVTIYNELSSQIAYLLCFFRHDQNLINSLNSKIKAYRNTIKSDIGKIGTHAKIYNAGSILNVNVGDYAIVEGASLLNNGTINSSEKAPSYIGKDVIARNFISTRNAKVSDGVQITNCFIGEAVEVGGGFSAENSLFFANSQALLGEACSIFAGPYTVTHHKSTLLIAGNFSFYNAGSATNQSNHMYKLGPVHQGTLERGCKTGSGSYILWPGKVSAFTMILGKHYNNPDTSEFPFSYLIEDNGKSVLMPGQNMFNVGTCRDIQKWPNRDKRTSDLPLDLIHFDGLNPFTINKIVKGIEVLQALMKKAKPDTKALMYKGVQISVASIKRGITLYEQMLTTYVGDIIVNNYDKIENGNLSQSDKLSEWIDLGGLFIREDKLDALTKQIVETDISIHEIGAFLQNEYKQLSKLSITHAISIANSYFNKDLYNNESLSEFLVNYQGVLKKNETAIISDAKKEFSVKSKIGFGLTSEALKEDDFLNVRGDVNNNNFIIDLRKEYHLKNEYIQNRINNLK